MVALIHRTSIPDPISNKQIRNEYVTAWLHQQNIEPTDYSDLYLDMNQIDDSFLHPQTTQHNSHLLAQANHSSRTNFAQGPGHRRCLSLMNPMRSLVTPTQPLSYEQQLDQHFEWRRQNYQLIRSTPLPEYPEYPEYPTVSVHPFAQEPMYYWPPQRSAEELAWERHNYYLRLQAEEEDLIERLLSDRKQGCGHRTQHKKPNQLWQPRQDTSAVARTGSLNRLSGPSQLSAETSRVLGLCRSSTLSAVKKIGFSKKESSRSSRSTSPAPNSSNVHKNNNGKVGDNHDSILTQGLGIHSYERTTTSTSNMTPATSSASLFSFSPKLSSFSPSMSAPQPSKKLLLKDHLAPSLKSLARRCSTRFGRGSRPNSYSGSSGDVVVEYPIGRRSLGSHPSQQQRGHLYDFKQLPTGPTGGLTDVQKPNHHYHAHDSRPRRSLTTERVPVHRKVTLFRSKSTRAPSSASMIEFLPDRPHRNSLRFANGRGLDFSSTPSISSGGSSRTRSSVDLKGSLATTTGTDETEVLPTITTTSVDSVVVSSVIPTSVLDLEEHEAMRQQIVAILSLDRNDMRRRPSSRPKSRNESSSQQLQQQQGQQVPQECLSPLAVEAQEILPEKKTLEEDEVAAELANPCEHIAFMLVPKSQYEFQPLMAQ
ncbi:hypothetical protein BGX23_009424 [Mortierella sp. AD031]|nr:hypothetical protein BGX23_009424 [Mortierella sp. AD031]